MTRISKRRFVAVAGLLAVAATGSGVAQQQSGGDRYARTLAEAEITARYNVQLEQQVRSQEQEIAKLEQEIAALDGTAVDVQPLLQRMFDELVQFVDDDVPFFKDERDRRIGVLRELMASVDASASEKYRRLLEAYQIELDYGQTLDAYEGRLGTGPDARTVVFAQLGRVSLMYRTLDGSETGYWDANQRMWVVDNSYAQAIEKAIRVANGDDNADLLTVPVPAPQEVRS